MKGGVAKRLMQWTKQFMGCFQEAMTSFVGEWTRGEVELWRLL